MARQVEILRGMQNLNTPHPPDRYPGLRVVKVGPGWPEHIIVPGPGDTIAALGGEWAPGYRTPAGAVAERIVLRAGDRATRIRADLPAHMAEWTIERA